MSETIFAHPGDEDDFDDEPFDEAGDDFEELDE